MLVISELFLFMLTPWLLPIVLFHILIVCVSLWSFDCFSWSLRSLSNHFAPLYSCSILFCDCFGPLFCHFGIFMITELSFYSFCMSSWLLSMTLGLFWPLCSIPPWLLRSLPDHFLLFVLFCHILAMLGQALVILVFIWSLRLLFNHSEILFLAVFYRFVFVLYNFSHFASCIFCIFASFGSPCHYFCPISKF